MRAGGGRLAVAVVAADRPRLGLGLTLSEQARTLALHVAQVVGQVETHL